MPPFSVAQQRYTSSASRRRCGGGGLLLLHINPASLVLRPVLLLHYLEDRLELCFYTVDLVFFHV